MMTVKQLKALIADLPDEQEVGVESSVSYQTQDGFVDRDALEGHQINGGYKMDFGTDEKPSPVFLLQIDREEDSTKRWGL